MENIIANVLNGNAIETKDEFKQKLTSRFVKYLDTIRKEVGSNFFEDKNNDYTIYSVDGVIVGKVSKDTALKIHKESTIEKIDDKKKEIYLNKTSKYGK